MSCLVAYYGDTSSDSDYDNEERDNNNGLVSVTTGVVSVDYGKGRSETEKIKPNIDSLPSTKRSLSSSNHSDQNEDEPLMKKSSRDNNASSSNNRNMSASKDNIPLRLPNTIHSMFREKDCRIDNPSDHESRVRSFPHVEGNWATHVYIPVTQDDRLKLFVHKLLEMFSPIKFNAMSEYHISLSRTVVIRHHWIESLVDSLRENLARLNSCLSDVISVKLLVNDEKTRTFVCLEVSTEDTYFLDYIKAINKSFAEFKLPPYYKDPSLHISIGWCLGDASDKISDEKILEAKEMLATFCAANPELSVVYTRHICCQSGNKSFLIPLLND